MWANWDGFLEKIADVHGLDQEEREAFLDMFAEKGKIKSMKQLSVKLNISESAIKTRMGKVYGKFAQICPGTNGDSRGKAKGLQVWLNQQYSAQPNIKSAEATFSSGIASPDWQKICCDMLESQKQSIRRQATEIVSEPFYVQLGLVERRHQPRRGSDFSVSPEQGSGFFQLDKEEIIETYQHNEFLEQVIKQKQSKKSQGKRIAIIGEPGAGKTTLLESIAFSPKTPGFPIWISLGSLGEKSLEEYLSQKWLKDALKTSDVTQQQKELEELFKSGEVLLLLDGVDEMPASSPVEALAKIREELTGWVADARVVLTCRINVWDASVNALQGFDTYRTLEFSYGDGNKPDQVREFICQWFSKSDKPERGEPLREKLEEDRHQRIRDLVKNPLRLSLLCQSWYFRQGDLPKTKAALYEQFTEAFYEWKKEPHSTTLTERNELNAALGELAKEAIDKEKSRFGIRRDFALKVMGEELFKLATEKLNWLVEVYKDAETSKPVYAFFHPTFQEYFAACVIDDWHYFLNHNNENPNPFLKHKGKDCVYRIFEPHWKEVILLWLGQEEVVKENKEEFIEALTKFNDGCKDFYLENGDKGFYELRGYFLAASGIGEFQKSIHAKGVVSQLVKLSEVDLDIEKQRSVSSMEPIAKEAKVILQAMERRLVISELINLLHLMYDNMDDYYDGLILKMCDVARLVLEVDSKNKEVIVALKKLFNGTNFSRRASAKVLIENKIEDSEAKEIYDKTQQEINQAIQDYVKNNSENNIVNSLIQYGKYLQDTMEMHVDKKDTNELINQLMNSEGLMLIATIKELETVGYSNIDVIMAMIKLLITSRKRIGNNSEYEFIGSEIVNSLLQVTPNELLPPIIYFFRKYLTDKVCQTDYVLYKLCYKVLWHCAQNMSYRDFYYAWHGELLQFQN